MNAVILFLKAHVAGYTRRDGTYVKPHNRKGGPTAHEAPGQLALFTTPAAPVQDDPEADLRAMWTEQGVPKEKQDELIAAIGAKAAPGAKVGPFTVGGSAAQVTKDSDLSDGTTIKDGGGNLFRVHYQRGPLVIAHPIVNGKAQVNSETTVRFWVDRDRTPSGDNDRTDPITVVPKKPEAQAREAVRSAKTGPTDDEAADPRRKYYVTMARDGVGVARLAGPFDTHDEALAHVDRARDEAEKVNPRASFDSFGTAGVVSDDHRPGVLNARLGIGASAGGSDTTSDKLKAADLNFQKIKDLLGNSLALKEWDVDNGGKVKAQVKTTTQGGVIKTKRLHVTITHPSGKWEHYKEDAKGKFQRVDVGVTSGTDPLILLGKNPAKLEDHQREEAAAPAPVTVTSRKRIRDPLEGSHTELTLSNGKVARIQRMSSGSTMGLPGWHDLDGGDHSYLDDTEDGAIKELLRRHGAAVSVAKPDPRDALTPPAERAIWIPNMKPRKLERLLSKVNLTGDDIEDLKDFEYFLLHQKDDAYENGFYERYRANQKDPVLVLKNKFWLTNIRNRIENG